MKYSYNYIDMKNIKRLYPDLFPVDTIGVINNMKASKRLVYYSGKLEICIRHSKTASTAVDIIDGKYHETPFPNIFLKVPSLTHATVASESRDYIYFSYSPGLYEKFLKHELFKPPYIRPLSMNPELTTLLNRIIKLSSQVMAYGMADKIDLLVFELLQDITTHYYVASNPYEQIIESKIRKIASFIQLNYNRDIDLEKLYRQNGFSRRSFFRNWNRFFDLTPAQYILELKINYALTQLRETSSSVWQICDELNFKDQYYLSKVIKKRLGVTPIQYRKLNSCLIQPNINSINKTANK